MIGQRGAFDLPFPQDEVQPWEQLYSAGMVVTSSNKGITSLNAQTEFAGGTDTFLDGGRKGGAAIQAGPALKLDSGIVDGQAVAWSIYRLVLGGQEPGVVSADVNLGVRSSGDLSTYYVAMADFAAGKWRWHGPFADAQVRLSLSDELVAGADFTSPLGNSFVAILAYDGAHTTVVGVGLNAVDGADETVPPVPTGLTATPIASGVELVWNDVIAADLAGYRIYYSAAPFTEAQVGTDARVKAIESLQGQTRFILGGQQGPLSVAVASLDITGHRSDISTVKQVTISDTSPPPAVVLSPTVAGGMRGDLITLTATGADSYDWDLDGDGSFEVTGDTTGAGQIADTSAPGLIRPKVRGTGPGPQGVAMGSVSLLILGNSRPTASAIATPQQGTAPLDVSFTGEAQDMEDAAAALTYAWDFNGDGTFNAGTDTLTPSPTYAAASLYNVRFRVTDSDGAYDTATVVIDVLPAGGGTNQVPTADLQADLISGTAPLTVAFDATGSSDPDGNVARYDWDFDGDGLWDVYDGPDQLSHVYPSGGSFTATLRVSDDEGGQDTDTQSIAVDPPLQALLTTDTPSVNGGDTVFLDASASTDDAVITDFRWDLDGDSVFNEAGIEASFQGLEQAAVIMPATPGLSHVSVQVLAADGADDIATLTLTVRGWLVVVVDSADDVGASGTSLAVVNGKPAISYFDNTNRDLKYAFSSLADGSSGWTALAVDSTIDEVGFNSSLAVVNGRPAVSYADVSNGTLKFAYSSTLDGSSGWTNLAVDSGDVGIDSSLAVVAGKPAISYYDFNAGNGDLKYAYSSQADGGGGWTDLAIDTTGNVGRYTSLSLVNAKPAISYYDGTNSDLKYAYSTQVDGSAGWTALTVDNVGDVGKFSSLAVVNGNPAIAYLDAFPNDDLKYAYSAQLDGSAEWTALTVDSTGQVGAECSLGFVAGRAAISHFDAANDDLKFAYSSEPEGGGWASQAVDSTGQGGRYTSVAEVDGRTAISYQEGGTNDDLKYAVLFE